MKCIDYHCLRNAQLTINTSSFSTNFRAFSGLFKPYPTAHLDFKLELRNIHVWASNLKSQISHYVGIFDHTIKNMIFAYFGKLLFVKT